MGMRVRGLVGGLGVLAFALVAWVVSSMVLGTYLRHDQQRAEATLQLTMQALDGHLRRFQAVPDLLADDPGLRALIGGSRRADQVAAINRWLEGRNVLLESSEIYVMDATGLTIAASNHDARDSFVGQDFSFRPYFTEAMNGGRGRFYALGTTSGVRGYYFASAVYDRGGRAAGVIAVKVDLDAIEAEWRRQSEAILVTDPEGVVFLSTEPEWLYQGFLPLTPDRLARTAALRRYAGMTVGALAHERSTLQGLAVLHLSNADGRRSYLQAKALMPLAGWTVQVLMETGSARAQARLASAAVLLGLGIAVGALVIWAQRRFRLAERIAAQEHAKAELERRVEMRTADLARMNAQIQDEVAERRATEAALRRTQADLVQAGKLAALGQMSAALSHEINQPLAAARNYADSAAILIDRGETAKARENVGQIVALIDRMAAIAQHLRNVARKPDAPLKTVDLAAAVAEALALAEPRLAKITVAVDLPADLPGVLGGPVRLQQVLGNVLSNAADALEDRVFPRIEIAARVEGDRVLLDIRDFGPGVAAAIADRIYDPFFTTKRVGSGLGLGLSISYNIMKDFGGDLRVANHPQGGAVFTLVLRVARARGMAAE